MVNYFQQLPDQGQEQASAIAKGFGGGLSQGIKTGLSQQLSGFLQQKKELGKVRSNTNLLSKRYEKGAFSPDALNSIEKRAAELVQSGNLSADDATMAAFEEYNQKSGLDALNDQNKSSSSNFAIPEGLRKFLGDRYEDLKGASAQAINPLLGLLDQISDIQNIGETPQRFLESKIRGESQEQFQEKEAERASKRTNLQDEWTKFTGGRNLPQNEADALIQTWIGGGLPGVAVDLYNKTKEGLGIQTPEWLKPVEDAAVFVLSIKGGNKFKLPNFKGNQTILKKAENLAKQSGKSPEFVIQEAANEAGVDLKKAAAGDVGEINKLNKRISKETPGAEKIKAAEKTVFNPEQAIKEREAHGNKLRQSPFGEYFEIENKKAKAEASKSPETRAKEAEVSKRVQPKINELEKQIDTNRKELANLESYAKKYTGQGKERLNLNIDAKNKAINRQLEELKDLKYELKYGKFRPTEAQLEIDAQNAANKIVDQVRNPTPENAKAFEDQIQKDQRFLDRAENIKTRGEFDKDFRPDEHIRIMEKYQKAYDAMVAQLRDEIKGLKGARDAESLKKISENREAIKRLEQRQKRHKANIVNQKDKIIALKSIEGPSGALYKNQIRKTQGNVAEFQKDFAQFKKNAETKAEIGTSHKGQKAIVEAGKSLEKATKAGEAVGKNPTQENIDKAAEVTGQRPEEIKQESKKLGDFFKERAEKIKEGRAIEQDVKSTTNSVNKIMSKWEARMRSTGKGLGFGFGVGVIQGVLENEFGAKIPSTYVTLGTTALGKPERLPGRVVGATVGKKIVNYFYDKMESSKLKSLRKDPNEYTKYIQSLRKRYGPKRVNHIIEDSK
jgi:hypothetical protein